MEFDGKFWIFLQEWATNNILYVTTTDPSGNGSFSATQTISTSATKPEPIGIEFNSKLYLFYGEDGGLGRLFYRTRAATSGWSGESQISSAFTNARPGVTVFDGKLYVFWETAGSDNTIRYGYLTSSGSFFGPYAVPEGKTIWAPAAATYNNQLYLVYTGQSGSSSKQIWYNALTLQGIWTGEAAVPGNVRSSYPIDATVFDGQLHVLYTGASTNNCLRKRLNGSSWSSEEWIYPLGCTGGAGIAPFSNELWMNADWNGTYFMYYVFP